MIKYKFEIKISNEALKDRKVSIDSNTLHQILHLWLNHQVLYLWPNHPFGPVVHDEEIKVRCLEITEESDATK